MIGTTRLAMCMEPIEHCTFMKVYSVWKKTYWKKGERRNDKQWVVIDNSTFKRYHFDARTFNDHFQLIDKETIKHELWNQIKQEYEKKKTPSTKTSSNG